MLIIYSGFILRVFLSYYNFEYDNLPGAGNDALAFHLEAIKFLGLLNSSNSFMEIEYDHRIGWFYSVFLAYVYKLSGTSSLLLGSILSSIVWLFSAIILRNILIKLKVDSSKINYGLIIYTFLFPTGIIYTAVTLREVYMLLLVNLIILYMIKLAHQKKILLILRDLTFFFILLILLASLHRSNVIFSVLFLLSIVAYYLIVKLNLKIFTVIFLAMSVFGVLFHMGYIEKLFDAIISYQLGHFHLSPFRASYYSKAEIGSIPFSLNTFVSHVLNNIFNYFLQPTFLKINTVKDTLLLFENLFRLALIVIIFIKLIKNEKRDNLFNLLLIMFFLSELPYSQATINWGTASRHHVQIFGLLMVLLFMPKKLINEK